MKPNPLKPLIGATALAAVLAIAPPAHAQLEGELGILDLTANGGLNPATGEPWADGDTYHLVYITTGTTDATATAIGDYNAFVQADADSEGMGAANWFVMGSTVDVDAIDNAVITGPVINIFDQGVVALDAEDFYNLDFSASTNPNTLAGEPKNLHTGTQGGGTVAGGNELGAAGGGVRIAWSDWTNWAVAWRAESIDDQRPLLAISEELTVSGPQAPFRLTITPNAETAGSYDLEWDSQAGKLYNLRTSTDLSGEISTWTLVEGAIEATPPTNLFTVAPTGATRFYAVEEFDVPPLLSENFEENNGGFTVATVEGTDWEHGAPDSSGLGGTVNSGNDGSANAWGTNLGTVSTAGGSPTPLESGFFVDPTNTALRSPVIDLTGVSGAELTFAEALDFPQTNDSAVVNLINATTDDVIAQIHVSEEGDVSTAPWSAVGPIDLAAGVGQQVRLEWRFEGAGGPNDDFMGWYIDDVVVTEITP
jgi:hypothetical protein